MKLERLARWSYRRRLLMLSVWIVALVGVTLLGRAAGGDFKNSFGVPGTESQRAFDLLKQQFPSQAGDSATIAFKAERVSDPSVRRRMQALFTRVGTVDHVLGVSSPYEKHSGRISPGGTIAFATVRFDTQDMGLPTAVATELENMAKAASGDGLQIEVGGEVIGMATEMQGASTQELLGLAAAIIVMILTFGSVIAMGLPILTAVFGLGIAVAAVELLSHLMSIPSETPELAAMIGIGVGIDYALLIVTSGLSVK